MSQETMRFPIRPRQLHDSASSSTRNRGISMVPHGGKAATAGGLRHALIVRFRRRQDGAAGGAVR
jgi:hypothetical protein